MITAALVGCSSESLEISVPPAATVTAPDRNLSGISRAAIDAALRFDSWRGNRSGYVALFAIDGQPVYGTAAGWADIASQTPMTLTTRMRFASMTKPITAVAAHMLIEEQLLSLDDPVAKYLPAFTELRVATAEQRGPNGDFPTTAADPILIKHLLMFASGIGPGDGDATELMEYWRANGPRSLETGSMQERVNHIAQLPLFEQPGLRWRYGWSADVLASVVEVVSGEPLDKYLERRIFAPLGMSNTRYRYADPAPLEIATVYTQDENGDLVISHPDSDVEYPEGGSGLVSTAEDYMRFALMLYNGGEYQGVRLLQAETVNALRSLQVAGGVLEEEGIEGLGWGLGIAVVADADASMLGDRDGDFWWSGYFGTTFFISPSTGLVGVVLSQNEPGPHSNLPLVLYGVQSLAFWGL